MKISAALPTGVTALLFSAAERRRRLEAAMVERLEAARYSEVILPILDYLEPYEPLLTPASRGELYRFVDREGELLALRSDFTPMLARLLAPRLAALELPLRLYYRGDVVRWEEERAGRRRELYQLGAELLGTGGEAGEREVLLLFARLLAVAGARPVRLVLGFAGALDRPLAAAAAAGGDPAALARAVERRERRAVAGGDADGVLHEVVVDGVPERPERLGPGAAARLAALTALAAEVRAETPGIEAAIDLAEFARHTLDPALAPGGAPGYYDGLVFRAYAGTGSMPVGAGGRYDRLFRRLGAEVPAAGFSLGLDRLLEAADESMPEEGGR